VGGRRGLKVMAQPQECPTPLKKLKSGDGDFTTAILRVWGVGGIGKRPKSRVLGRPKWCTEEPLSRVRVL